MPAPHHPDSVADAPVNIAPPNWQCPHCLTKYYQDLEAATACARAGMPAPVTAGTPVLLLQGTGRGSRRSMPVLGLTKVGPVTPVNLDGTRHHRRDVVVVGERVDPARLTDAAQGNDGLLIVTDTRGEPSAATVTNPEVSTYGNLAKLFLGKGSFGEYYDAEVTVWASTHSHRSSDWWAAPDDQQRAALNTVTAGLLDTIAATPEADLAAQIRATYAPGRRAHRTTQRPADISGPEGGLLVADAHGAPNHIWALRWLTAHLAQVTTWQARTLRAWAVGNGEPVPGAVTLRIHDALPNNPGKRRLAVMAPYGDDYRVVRDTVLKQLTTDAPLHPVPGLGDVAETIRATHEGN